MQRDPDSSTQLPGSQDLKMYFIPNGNPLTSFQIIEPIKSPLEFGPQDP